MNYFDSRNREALLKQISTEIYDLLIVGGGATGSGIALDAASRGMKTVLVDKQDFAAGTSSRSTKLIHGGLRYLKQFEIALVREVGRERAIVHRLAPHLVVNEKMLLPLIIGGTYGKLSTSVGLMIYDVLAGVESADQRIMLSKEETLEKEPLLKADVVEGSGLYAEYRTDDARLTIEVLKTAGLYGAHPANYVEVNDFIYKDERVVGAKCTDLLSGNQLEIRAKQVVSAAGPWVDELREKNRSMNTKRLHLTKGVHIVVPRERLPIKQSVYFDVPDGRMIFAIPRGEITYIGTTDTDYHGQKESPLTNKEDVIYLINAVNNTFPTVKLTMENVISSWAGLRPLIHEEGKSASELSRKDEIFVSDSKLISIAGGKLTGYRKMAERVVDAVDRRLSKKYDASFKKCTTDKIILKGGGFEDPGDVKAFRDSVLAQLSPYGFTKQTASYLVHNYGMQVDTIIDHFIDGEDHSPEGLIQAEVWFCLNFEMINSALDFFSRRTGRLYFDIQSVRDYRTLVLDSLEKSLNWTEKRREQEEEWLTKSIHQASVFPSLEDK